MTRREWLVFTRGKIGKKRTGRGERSQEVDRMISGPSSSTGGKSVESPGKKEIWEAEKTPSVATGSVGLGTPFLHENRERLIDYWKKRHL